MPYDIIIGRNQSDKKIFQDKGLIFLGKGYVKMGQHTSLSNKIYMDVARSHVVLVAGKRGSGKSYTLGVITEELSNLPKNVSQNIASLIFDTMGVYWTMKYLNEKDRELLQNWGLKTKNLPVKVFVPFGHYDLYVEKGIPVDESFALDVSELNSEDWIITFGLDMINPVSILIERTISKLKKEGKFAIREIVLEFHKDGKASDEVKNAAVSLFEAAETWGVFSTGKEEATQVKDLIRGGTTSVLDLSVYNSIGAFNVRALVISLISKKIFNQRMEARKSEEVEAISKGWNYMSFENKRDSPLAWIFIDEAHEFLPMKGKTSATDALIQLLREGRQPGISVVLATQQPGKIHTDAMTQSDIVLSHRLTAKVDTDAMGSIIQSYLRGSLDKELALLPRVAGACIAVDDVNERMYPMQIRPRYSWHGGGAPKIVEEKKKALEF
mgnify:CR=1 FL=1